jgi:beta-phosphoglucomutase family hydrolase
MSPPRIQAAIFDLDGVLTRTARLHAKAWKSMFDEFLGEHVGAHPGSDRPFDIESDYREHVDGKPRYDGARSFLHSRGIELSEGGPDDEPGRKTVCGLGNRKNALFQALLQNERAETYPDAVEQLTTWRKAGLKLALITSSRNGRAVLDSVGLADAFDVVIDGVEAAKNAIRGKPAPDVFLEAARRMNVPPSSTVVLEDAVSGVTAGRAGGFGLVVGVDRDGSRDSLLEHGADVVVSDVRQIDLETALDDVNRLETQPDGESPAREMKPWTLTYRNWTPKEQPLREALCAVGNGIFVTRGAFEEVDAGGPHYPGTYLAGGYNRLDSEIADRIITNEDLVNWPNWLPLTFRPEGGEWLHTDNVEILEFELTLDVQRGLLTRTMQFRDAGGRESLLVSRRLVSMASPQYAAIEWTLKPLNWSGTVDIRSALDGSVVNGNVARYRSLSNRHLDVLSMGQEGDDAIFLTVRTNQSLIRMTQAARARAFVDDVPAPTVRRNEQTDDTIAQLLRVECAENRELRIEKVVAIRTSHDLAISEPEEAARKDIRRAPAFAELVHDHETKWRHLWTISDIELHNGDAQTQFILRLHLFHLLQTISPNTMARDVGVPARGWHGEAYRGHIFWDELFIFPLLVLRVPELARSVLMYRYRRLPEARHMARRAGSRGAMYPWQSGSDGREESQVVHLNPASGNWLPDTTHLQRHVNSAIAYNVWAYYQASGDIEFLAYHGAEMIIEIARFWASIAQYDADRERYVIEGVVGPDEFHTDDPHSDVPGLKNNAYTNVLASWVLRCACDVLDELDEQRQDRLKEELHLGDDELQQWDDISRRLFVPFHDDGIISQFEGYELLQEFDWEGYREQYGDIHRLDRLLEAEGDDVNRYRASKQADVLMLLFLFPGDELRDLFSLLGYELTDEMTERNIDYYMQRTSHGSTLSRIVHSWVLARRDRGKAWQFWQEALHSDIQDIQGGTTPEGIHLGAMAGTVDLIHRGHAGIVIRDDTLWFDPQLPDELADVRMRVRFRRHWLTVLITQRKLTITVDRGGMPAVKIGVCGDVVEMGQGETRTFVVGTRD